MWCVCVHTPTPVNCNDTEFTNKTAITPHLAAGCVCVCLWIVLDHWRVNESTIETYPPSPQMNTLIFSFSLFNTQSVGLSSSKSWLFWSKHSPTTPSTPPPSQPVYPVHLLTNTHTHCHMRVNITRPLAPSTCFFQLGSHVKEKKRV